MALVDDPDVQWPDAVLPGSPAAQSLLARRYAADEADKARRAALGWAD